MKKHELDEITFNLLNFATLVPNGISEIFNDESINELDTKDQIYILKNFGIEMTKLLDLGVKEIDKLENKIKKQKRSKK